MSMVAMLNETVLCSNRSHSWHATAFTYPLGSLFHTHATLIVIQMGCLCTLPQSENDWVLCLAVSQWGCPFCVCCFDVTVSMLSIETDRSWTTSNQASYIFQTHPYLLDGRGLGKEQPLSFGAFTSSSVESRLVRVA